LREHRSEHALDDVELRFVTGRIDALNSARSTARMTRYDAPNAGETPYGCWEAAMKLLKRLLRWLSILFGPGGGTQYDPFANKPAPLKPRPKTRSGSVAVAEPDDD
jgi:hypothetical protein